MKNTKKALAVLTFVFINIASFSNAISVDKKISVNFVKKIIKDVYVPIEDKSIAPENLENKVSQIIVSEIDINKFFKSVMSNNYGKLTEKQKKELPKIYQDYALEMISPVSSFIIKLDKKTIDVQNKAIKKTPYIEDVIVKFKISDTEDGTLIMTVNLANIDNPFITDVSIEGFSLLSSQRMLVESYIEDNGIDKIEELFKI